MTPNQFKIKVETSSYKNETLLTDNRYLCELGKNVGEVKAARWDTNYYLGSLYAEIHTASVNHPLQGSGSVTLPDGVWDVIDNQLKGKIGNRDSEVIQNIVIAYLMERDYLMKPKEKSASIDQVAGELDIHDAMITLLVELLERKGILKQEEWKQNIKKQVALK